MRRRLRLALGLLIGLAPGLAQAVEPDEVLPDAGMEARARAISSELRCLVCQNQSIDDSHATLARDLRLLVRERLKAGDSDEAVRQYLVARYGDFVLLRPPVERDTLLLWGLPFLVLACGAAGLALARRHGSSAGARPAGALTEAEQDALDRLLGQG